MTGIIKTSSCMDQIFFWLLTGKTRLLPADSNDLFKVTLDDLDLAIVKLAKFHRVLLLGY